MLGTRAFLTTAVSLVVLGIGSVRAQTPVQLAPVIVTATRTEAAPFDIPASVDRVDGSAFRDGRSQVNLSEGLAGVPGLLARDRQNHAQDVQISVRGFGARSTFGIRGVRLYVDGIPATLPDGQGQITHADLGSVGRVEVLRGPFSALYGNASGGVIQVFTEDGAGPPTVTAGTAAGSDDLRRHQLKFSGAQGGLGYVGDWSRFATDGYRNHSAAARSLGNVKLTLRPDEASRLTLIANSMSLQAQDPLGLTRAQFEADSRSADAAAIDFDTRKSVDQTQFGLVYERRLDDRHSIRALVYAGERSTQQFQSIPTGPQANPLHPGGVIDLGRRYRGTDLRWTIRGSFADAPYSLIAGLAYDTLDEHRRGYQNFIGTALGVQGALRRDERNTVWNLDPYVQATWRPAPRWSLQAGLRRSSVHFDSADHYVAGSNADDSGHARYGATLQMFGAMYDWSDTVHVYASAGRGFETPTLNELAYRPNGDTGLNFGLRPATSDSLEAGIKARLADRTEATAAVFETRTEREIVTLTNTGGRTTYQNAGATRRRGLELSATQRWARDWRAQAAYTWLDAVYRDAFATCTASPCAAPNLTITAGNRIPGVARSSLSLSLHWAPPLGWRASIEGRYVGRVYVNDANSDAAEGYATAGAGVGYVMRAGAWQLSGYARVENFLDARYVGSVIVNEGNGRYFEPAPGRTWVAGLSGSLSF